jgi:hypothetical protein
MNRSGSHPNYEKPVNAGHWEGSPPLGLDTARRGKFGFRETRVEAAAKAPAGAAAFIISQNEAKPSFS